MKTITIRNTTIGKNEAAICVPLVGHTKEEILQELSLLKEKAIDIVEWRMDMFAHVNKMEAVLELLNDIRHHIKDRVLLATFRTIQEGGEYPFTQTEYCSLYHRVLASGFVDMIDVELFIGDDIVKELLEKAHQNNVLVILSNHDFHQTPSQEEIVSRLRRMQEMNGDVCKIALMPTCKQDVVSLLQATVTMKETYADRPIVTMSMTQDGVVSRIFGDVFGSAITFASLQKASAPGQIPLDHLLQIRSLLHSFQK